MNNNQETEIDVAGAPGLVVRSDSTAGVGVFSLKKYQAGERIGIIEGSVLPAPTRYSICVEGIHLDVLSPFRQLNHSCRPNSECRGRYLVALESIQPDDEVTIDYAVTEKVISHPFPCGCGASSCRGFIETATLVPGPSGS